MLKRACLNILVFIIFLSLNISAAEETVPKAGIGDKMIASTFKTLAKAYVATVNLEKVKKTQISHLEGMNDNKFQKRFQEIQSALAPLPTAFKTKYGLKEQMTKEEVIAQIDQLDKKWINQMIEETPDTFIALQFKNYLRDLKQDTQESDWVKKIHEFWEGIIPRSEK